jgi:hypothetical protein
MTIVYFALSGWTPLRLAEMAKVGETEPSNSRKHKGVNAFLVRRAVDGGNAVTDRDGS